MQVLLSILEEAIDDLPLNVISFQLLEILKQVSLILITFKVLECHGFLLQTTFELRIWTLLGAQIREENLHGWIAKV